MVCVYVGSLAKVYMTGDVPVLFLLRRINGNVFKRKYLRFHSDENLAVTIDSHTENVKVR